MNQEMKNRLLALNPEALVEILEAVCGYSEIELSFGQDPSDCINEPIFYVYGGLHAGTFTVLNYDPTIHDKAAKYNIDMDPTLAHVVRVEGTEDNICDLLSEAISASSIGAYEIISKPDNGCGCYQDPPCLGCATKTYLPDEPSLADVPVDPEANRLHLFAVWTINADTSETDKVYIMALHEEGAACLYHQSRARDHANTLCEVVVSKIADSEVCDG